MSNFLYIIHPKDATTDFLENIYLYLIQKYPERVVVNRLTSRDDHQDIFRTIREMSNNFLYLFLGHGTSTALSGAIARDFEYPIYISENQLSIFEGKNVVLLSCRSNQYLMKYFKPCKLKSAIGFPNMITDEREIEYPEPNSFEEIVTKDDILAFRTILVDAIKYSLEDYLVENLSSHLLFSRLKLRVNRKLIDLYKQKSDRAPLPLEVMLSKLADGIYYSS